MKIKIYVEESFTTTITREEIIIDTENYPELEGMTEDEISEYIDNNIWDMKSTDSGVYSSLGEECTDQSPINEDINNEDTNFYVESL